MALGDQTQVTPDPLTPGRTLGGCRLIAPLHEDATGITFLAEHNRIKRRCAIKARPARLATREAIARLQSEASACAVAQHPNVVTAFNVGVEHGVHFVELEHVDGDRLDRVLTERGRLQPEEAVRIVTECCKGLVAVHAHGIVHRALAPGSVLLGKKGHVKLTGFASATLASDPHLKTALLPGAPGFMPPEQGRGEELDPRSDLYSLGALWYALLTGTPPAAEAAPAPPAGVSPQVAQIVLRMLSRAPADRCQRAADVLAALDGPTS
jgi:serine/threonine-protein kinase